MVDASVAALKLVFLPVVCTAIWVEDRAGAHAYVEKAMKAMAKAKPPVEALDRSEL